jgi:hypothetical protein
LGSWAPDTTRLGANANITVRNSGTITGGNGIAINLGNGNNVIEITGGQITGDIVSGAGAEVGCCAKPPCGEGLGVGVARFCDTASPPLRPPSLRFGA